MSALTTVPKRRRRSIIARVGWSRFLQEIGMLAPAIVLMTVFLITPFVLSFWTAMTNPAAGAPGRRRCASSGSRISCAF